MVFVAMGRLVAILHCLVWQRRLEQGGVDAKGWVVLCVVGNLHVGDVGARYRTSIQYVRIWRISRSRQLENSSIYQ